MLLFAIQLDEERIIKDEIIDLAAAWRTIENTFAQADVKLYHQDGNVRFYTRNIDNKDFEYLFMVNDPFREESWFQYYIKTWKFLEVDDETNELETEEDLIEAWVTRPSKP